VWVPRDHGMALYQDRFCNLDYVNTGSRLAQYEPFIMRYPLPPSDQISSFSFPLFCANRLTLS